VVINDNDGADNGGLGPRYTPSEGESLMVSGQRLRSATPEEPAKRGGGGGDVRPVTNRPAQAVVVIDNGTDSGQLCGASGTFSHRAGGSSQADRNEFQVDADRSGGRTAIVTRRFDCRLNGDADGARADVFRPADGRGEIDSSRELNADGVSGTSTGRVSWAGNSMSMFTARRWDVNGGRAVKRWT